MNGFTSNPSTPFTPSSAYTSAPNFLAALPGLNKTVQKFSQTPFPMKGIDFTTGETVDLNNPQGLQQKIENNRYRSDFGANLGSGLPSDYQNQIRALVELDKQLTPSYLEKARAAAQLQQDLSYEQIRALYPLMSRAQRETIAANLGASEYFLGKKESSPSNIAAIMARKQEQMTQAASAEGERQRATAMQQQAATDAARGFVGQYIRSA